MRPGVGAAAGLAEHTRRWGQQAGLPLTPAALPVGGGGVNHRRRCSGMGCWVGLAGRGSVHAAGAAPRAAVGGLPPVSPLTACSGWAFRPEQAAAAC